MFVYFTRVFWMLAQPMSLVLLLLALGLALGFTRYRRTARLTLALALAVLGLAGFTTTGYLLMQPLEQRFARPAEPDRIAGIVVLGGAMDSEVNEARGGYELSRSGNRLVEAIRLAQHHPEAKLLFAGGAGALSPGQEPEALAADRLFRAYGLSPDRILLDRQSRNTEENARFARAIADGALDSSTAPGAAGDWLLVTSAFHMPRAMGLFRRAGFAVTAWPTDYYSRGDETFGLKLSEVTFNITVTSLALREWTALAGYRLTDRIDALLPGPAP